MHLAPHVQKSWFDFDHFFSNGAFPRVLQILVDQNLLNLDFEQGVRIQDIGANTGNFALACLQKQKNISVFNFRTFDYKFSCVP